MPKSKNVVGSAEVINFGTRIEAILSVDSKDSKSEATKEAILDELEKRILKRLEEKGDKNIKGNFEPKRAYSEESKLKESVPLFSKYFENLEQSRA